MCLPVTGGRGAGDEGEVWSGEPGDLLVDRQDAVLGLLSGPRLRRVPAPSGTLTLHIRHLYVVGWRHVGLYNTCMAFVL